MSRATRIRGPLLAIVALGGFAALFHQNTALVGSDSAPPLPGWALVKIERTIETALEKQGIPGLSIALSYHGRHWSAGFGLADVEQQVPVTPETVFRFASISKPITAVAVLKLVESGQIDLDAPINRYLPHYPRQRWPVSCKNLLTHQAGIRHYRGHELESTHHYTALPDTLAIFKNDPLEFEPASKYLYSTYGFNLLGAIVEEVTGRGFVSYLRNAVFEPAGMTSTRDDDAEALIPHRAAGYRKGPTGTLKRSALSDISNKIPGGGLCGTALDLVAFAEALDRDTLLRPETIALMNTEVPTRDHRPTGYALGWNVGHRRGVREVWHTGSQPQVSTILYTQPDRDLAIAILSNLEDARVKELAQHIADTITSPAPATSPALGVIP